jgi:hypothetical protein
MKTKKVKALNDKELLNVLGGKFDEPVRLCSGGQDDVDCTSELASGGGTTDTE